MKDGLIVRNEIFILESLTSKFTRTLNRKVCMLYFASVPKGSGACCFVLVWYRRSGGTDKSSSLVRHCIGIAVASMEENS